MTEEFTIDVNQSLDAGQDRCANRTPVNPLNGCFGFFKHAFQPAASVIQTILGTLQDPGSKIAPVNTSNGIHGI